MVRISLKQLSSLIRKLDIKEVGLIKRGWDQNNIGCLPLSSKFDLFEKDNLSILKTAILKVMKSEELMRSRIVKKSNSEYFYETLDLAKYNFENVKFLRVNDIHNKPSIESNQLVTNFIFDHMAINEINPDNDDSILIWRMYFFEVDLQKKLYRILSQFHHAAIQGAQVNLIIQRILKTFEMIHKKQPFELKESRIFPGCENLLNLKEKYDSLPAREPVKRPSFINPEQARANQLSKPIPTFFGPNAQVVCVDTNTRFESIANLIQSSRHNHTRQKVWCLDDGQLKTLMIRSTRERAKINSVLELISCLALKKLYQSCGATDEEFSNMIYHTVISLRDGQRTGQKTVDQDTLGLVTGGLIIHPDISAIEQIVKNEDKLNDLFWPLAKKLSDEMHHRIIHDPSRYFVKIKPAAKDEINFHFSVSNLGMVDEKQFLQLTSFEFSPGFSLCTSEKDKNGRLFFIWFYGLYSGQRLGIGLYYNSHFIDESMMEKYIYFLNKLLDDVVKVELLKSKN